MKKKVVIMMSGGVDSSVAAILLKKQGYECVGVHLRLWSNAPRAKFKENTAHLSQICRKLKIPLIVLNVAKKFKKEIIDYFMNEYCSGRTPNPCVKCNKRIKFRELLKISRKLKADFIATGHYAKKTPRGLEIAKDKEKDQSYFLYDLTPEMLKHAIFPLGNLTKSEVRKIAEEAGFKSLNKKKESQDLCFVPNGFYADFLKKYLTRAGLRSNLHSRLQSGPIKDSNNEKIGTHNGIALYTIGQRKNLGISGQKTPLYITKIDKKSNTIFVGPESDLFSKKMTVKNLNFVSCKMPKTASVRVNKFAAYAVNKFAACAVKIRYRAKAVPAKIKIKKLYAEVIFSKPQRAITPGQSAVFYKGNLVIGGGIIK